jgi:hypothetical protein
MGGERSPNGGEEKRVEDLWTTAGPRAGCGPLCLLIRP